MEDELKAAENLSIQDYIRESQNIASLHHQIVECDQVGFMSMLLKLWQSIFFFIGSQDYYSLDVRLLAEWSVPAT